MVMAANKKKAYAPYSPANHKKSVQTVQNSPKKRIMTSKPKGYMPPGMNDAKFVGQSPLDNGRIKKVHTNNESSS